MTQVIAVGTHKGGVGKTSSSLLLATYLAREGKRILLVDADPQSNLTFFAVKNRDRVSDENSVIAAVLPEDLPDGPKALKTVWPGVRIWAATPALANAANLLTIERRPRADARLELALEKVEGFDLVIIDVPPAVGQMSVNAYNAADLILVPFACDVASSIGLGMLLENLSQIQEFSQRPKTIRIFPNLYDKRINHDQAALLHLRREVPELLVQTKIPRATVIRDALAERQALYDYDPGSKADRAFAALAQEVEELLVDMKGEESRAA